MLLLFPLFVLLLGGITIIPPFSPFPPVLFVEPLFPEVLFSPFVPFVPLVEF